MSATATYTETTIRLSIDTTASSAFTNLEWIGDSSSCGDLVITYRSGMVYRYSNIYFRSLMDLVTAADEHDSLGKTLSWVLQGAKKGVRVK